ncbi:MULTISPECIES: hypothetical protein [unclassified Saccharopolyspora]|uniref:hypothetical protein n=1 Tax=unclassified Saccharopolyspora TaxID=2646250 RepID=UPI001CD419B2|nr:MULTISPECIES: hypothetical protein [unclassified Saccharopolyspora]MCA1188887.1 hypothetical protein [Saccharopolyspora sp. 6T]MCA1195450.1 hypothetical protein [Saccharopolyspora sp. 6V]MCA1227298.1 hypothetical protein [Saccharopolyspora sp. 6M]MCA1279816.1 hypothetical protein [Saccharopolyspora sp. 7B]
MHEQAQGAENTRSIHVAGPLPDDPDAMTIQRAELSWFLADDGRVQMTMVGPPPDSDITVKAPDVFAALLAIREMLHDDGWRVLVNAARREAWGGTPEHPCGLAQVRIYPSLTGPPAADPVDALDMPDDPALVRSGSVIEQTLWHKEWAGTIPPDGLTWTEFERRSGRSGAGAAARSGGERDEREQRTIAATAPELTHSEPVPLIGPSPDGSKRSEMHRGVAEWGRRPEGGVHLRLRGPFGRIDGHGPDVFTTLQDLRQELLAEDWGVLVNGALFGAWRSTPQHPCGLAHIRIYPSLTGPPLTEQLDALGTPPGRFAEMPWSMPVEQVAWQHEWAGTTPAGRRTWTERDRDIRARKNTPYAPDVAQRYYAVHLNSGHGLASNRV